MADVEWAYQIYNMMLRSFVRQYYGQAYSKFRISRTPQESLVFFFKNQITVEGLLGSIRQNFNTNNNILLAGSTFQPSLIGYPILPQAQKATEQLGDQLLLPLLISGELFIYEGVNGRVQLCYAIECDQFNQTNSRNLPQHVANGVIDLNSQWLYAKTVGEALSPPTAVNSQSKEVMEEREEVRNSIQKAHMRLLQLNRFRGEYYAGSPTHTFTVRMMALMTLNWAFLFGVTYGKYGWDVGEPISYLSALAVDLAAMAGVFDLEKQLQKKIAEQQGRWWGMLNIQGQKRAQAWLLSYHRRQYY